MEVSVSTSLDMEYKIYCKIHIFPKYHSLNIFIPAESSKYLLKSSRFNRTLNHQRVLVREPIEPFVKNCNHLLFRSKLEIIIINRQSFG